MSGPKLSEAELAQLEQARLERERMEAIRRMKRLGAERDRVAQCQKEAESILSGELLSELAKTDPAQAASLKNRVLNTLAALKTPQIPADNTAEEVEAAIRQLQYLANTVFENLMRDCKKADERFAVRKRQRAQAMDQREISALLQRSTGAVQTAASSFDYDGARRELQSRLLRVAALLEADTADDLQIHTFCNSSAQMLRQSANRSDLAEHEEAALLQAEQIINTYQELLRRKRERESLYADYCAVAAIMGIDPQPVSAFADVSQMQKEKERLHAAYRKKDEMDFIANQINQVMIDLGYTFVSSHVLTRQDGTEYDDTLYRADDTAGVRVYTDESGAVMMQVTSLGDGAMTDADVEDHYQLQLAFCASHQDIVDALAAKGIYLKAKNYAPPSKKYAVKQQAAAGTTVQSIDRRKRRRAKKMRSL